MKSILDPKFKYHDSASTDIRRTFARIRRERKREAKRLGDRAIIELCKARAKSAE